MENELNQLFLAQIVADKKYIKDYIINWEYIDKVRKRKANSGVVEAAEFFRFNGKEDLLTWFAWLNQEQNSYLPESQTAPLVDVSISTDKNVFEQLGLPFDFPLYKKNIGLDNAIDFLFPFLYPSPDRYKIQNVLDFGAGFGRQANLYTKDDVNFNYIAMDAIPKSYCLQHTYFKTLDRGVVDYLDNPEKFEITFNKKGFHHIPTWRYDLIPDGSLDLVICVQVLPELSTELVTKMLSEFHRMLKAGGFIYIRDHKQKWVPAGKVDKDKLLFNIGFTKEFEAHIVDKNDIHGIPRIWRKTDAEVMAGQNRTKKEVIWQWIWDADAFTGGLLNKLNKRINLLKY